MRRSSRLPAGYPKAKQLGTNLNRDAVRELVLTSGLDTGCQVALVDTWSARRLVARRTDA
jgi:hypothetical protein